MWRDIKDPLRSITLYNVSFRPNLSTLLIKIIINKVVMVAHVDEMWMDVDFSVRCRCVECMWDDTIIKSAMMKINTASLLDFKG